MRPLELPGYAELHCLSNFSFLRGASHPEELVRQAHALGYAALAITDECSLSGVVRAHSEAKKLGLKLIIGSQFALEGLGTLVLLAKNRQGYGNLSELITQARSRAAKGSYVFENADLDLVAQDCIALWHPPHDVMQPDVLRFGHALAARFDNRLAARFPNCAWLLFESHLQGEDRARLQALRTLGRACGLPLAAAGDVHMHTRGRRALQDLLTAIRLGTPVAQCGYALFANGERHLRPRFRLSQLYPEDCLQATLEIAARCTFSLDELRYEYPKEIVPETHTPTSWLAHLVEKGCHQRFPAGTPDKVKALLAHELALIAELQYEAYFLTVEDIVRFARTQGILCQGRGSAANSAVCYCLGITEVDPSRMSVLFERFISKERNEPPDIDVDFEHQRREEVIQYIYAKYGRDRAALTANLITYRPKSALRDCGKALGLALDQIDRISKTLSWWDARSELPQRLREAGFDPENRVIRLLLDAATTLIGFPRHLSQHPGGFVLARGKLSQLVPIENARMPERSVIQWDKDDLDALGLMKVDVLALGMLSAIRRTLDVLSKKYGRCFQLQDVPAEDLSTYAMLSRGDSVGVFQVESRAQMAMLPKLAPHCFYDLVIEVAIVRPGPIQGGMVHPYLKRKQGIEAVTYPSREVESVLERTLGVPIFQEQVMQLAIVAAGFSAGEADQLRRAMAAWKRKGGLEPFEEKIMSGMLARGYRAEFASALYRQIRGFGEYGFPESHAASFALLAYVSAWLKCHEPAAFLCGLLNSQPMGFYAPAQLIADARRHGVEVLPVDVCVSEVDCVLEAQAVRLGLRLIGGLSEAGAKRLWAARKAHGVHHFDDLAAQAKLDSRDMHALAAAGALANVSGHRRHAQWQALGLAVDKATESASASSQALTLALGVAPETMPALPKPTEGEDIVSDYARLGFTLGRHPLALLRPRLTKARLSTAAQLRHAPHGRLVRACGIVTHRQRPETAKGAVFITLEDETGCVNVVVWERVAQAQRVPMLASRLLAVHGVWETDGRVHHLIAGRLIDHSSLLGGIVSGSRDFR
jgi:error-prone DNA polymerase